MLNTRINTNTITTLQPFIFRLLPRRSSSIKSLRQSYKTALIYSLERPLQLILPSRTRIQSCSAIASIIRSIYRLTIKDATQILRFIKGEHSRQTLKPQTILYSVSGSIYRALLTNSLLSRELFTIRLSPTTAALFGIRLYSRRSFLISIAVLVLASRLLYRSSLPTYRSQYYQDLRMLQFVTP